MGATVNPKHAELILHMENFVHRVGLIYDYDELWWIGLKPRSLSGSFGPQCCVELIQFCAENRDYHIVSSVSPGRYINRYEPGDHIYFLANGDNSPNLILNHTLDPEWPLIAEDGISAALAELDDIKDRNK